MNNLMSGKMPKKSLTLTKDNDTNIQQIRSIFLGSDIHLDIDYTTVVNILLEIGYTTFNRSNSDTITLNLEEIADIIIKNLKKNKLDREFWKNYLPKLIKE